jgi:arylsulfatase A-like enzyme
MSSNDLKKAGRFLGKVKYIVIAFIVGFILFWAIFHLNKREDYTESEYFISYFPFALKSYAFESSKPSLKKLKLEKVTIDKNQTAVIRLPMDCQLDYYLKIPRGAALKLLLKHYGYRKLKALEEIKISAQQEEHEQTEFVRSIKFPKGLIKNQWKTEHINLDRYSEKIIKLSFNAVRYGGSSKLQEGFFIRPLLLLNKNNLPPQHETASPVHLDSSGEKLKQINVIMIVLDAARPDHFGCYGYHRQTTPYIDEFAKESVIFRNAFSVAPYTLASTTSLFTSLYPCTHKVVSFHQMIPQKLITLADVFARHDYATYGSGFILKWTHKGFKETFKLSFSSEKDFKDSLDSFMKKSFSDKKNNFPSFIYMHLDPPHSDYNPPEKFDKWSDTKVRAKYAELIKSRSLFRISKGEQSLSNEELQFIIDKYDGNLLWADWLVHQILEYIKEFRIYDNSLIIVASDHGEAFYEHSKLMHNSTVYNEMIKIPIIMHFPSYIKLKKRHIDAFVENIDIMPTILDFLQIKQDNLKLQGKSLLPLIFGDSDKIKTYLFARAVAKNDRIFCLYDSRYKFIQMFDQEEFYCHQSDPQEKVNLALNNPILCGYYRSLAFFYRKQLTEAHTAKAAKTKLDEETIAKLRSLGYLQ